MMKIGKMHQQHLTQAFSLTRQLNWPHRLADWEQALALGEGLAAEENGELLGTLLFWRWGTEYATLGLIIVADKAQGKGIGRQLMERAMTELEGYNLRLHATEMGKKLYEKLGFVSGGQIIQHQCRELAAVEPVTPAPGQKLRAARRDEAHRLTRLDTQAHGLQRPALIASLFDEAETVLVLEEQQDITGFASLRRFGHGFVIGPIICRTRQQAKVLVSALMANLSGEFLRIDTDHAYGLSDWLTTLGMAEVDAPTIMHRGNLWQPEAMRAFGLMTQAMA